MQKGFATTTKPPEEKPKTQTSSSGSVDKGRRKAPLDTLFRRRRVGDRVKTHFGIGIIIQIQKNGHERYLVDIPNLGKKWFAEQASVLSTQ